MKKERKPEHFLSKPIYEGGQKAMREFISKNLTYPKQALDSEVEGTVKLRYDINYQGKVVGAKILKSLGHGCDEEAIRLVHLLKFKVGKIRKVKVLYHKTINIHFRLPVAARSKPAKTQPSHMQYTLVWSTKPAEKARKTSTYNYTIQIRQK